MATERDLLMYVTGVVGRAMGSGKFTLLDIEPLTLHADVAFRKVFGDENGELDDDPGHVPPPATSATPAGTPEIVAEGKSFRVWEGDKLGIGNSNGPLGKPWKEHTWAEIVASDLGRDEKTRGFVEWVSNLEVKDDKYKKYGLSRQARARAVLAAYPKGKA